MRSLAVFVTLTLAGLYSALPSRASGAGASRLSAILRPVEVLDLSPATEGILSAVHVNRGDRVKQGQVVAELNANIERANMELARIRAENDDLVAIAKIELQEAQRRFERNVELRDDGVISKKEFQEIKANLELMRHSLNKAHCDAQVAKLEYERSRILVERRRIESPIDGVVTERNLSPGELVSHSRPMVVLQLADLDPLIADVQVPVSMLGRIKLDQKAELIIEHPQAQYRLAEVKVIGPIVDAASATFNVRLELANPGDELPSGLRCNVRFLE